MKKKIIVIITIIILAILCVIFVIPKIIFGNVNYKELTRDIKSIKKQQEIIYAKPIDKTFGGKETYKGKGYEITIYRGGDVVDYVITANNKKIWKYSQLYQETTR